MKKLFLKSVSLFAIVAMLTSCDDDVAVRFDSKNGQSLVGFNQSNFELPVYTEAEMPANYDNTVYFEVQSSVSADYDRTFTVVVNEEFSTVDVLSYEISSTFTIPAGQFVGTIAVKGEYNDLPSDFSSEVLVLDLTDVQDMDVFNEQKTRAIVSLYRSCVQEPAKNYTGVVTDPSAGAPSFPVELVPVTGVFNTWTAANIWGDFVAAATGNPSYAGAYPYPVQLKINCDNTVTVVGTNSQYGAAGGNTGTYVPSTKVLTLTVGQALFQDDFDVTARLTPAAN